MSNIVYDNFIKIVSQGYIILDHSYKIMLTYGYNVNTSDVYVSDAVYAELPSTGNYARLSLTNVALTEDDVNDILIFSADDVVWPYAKFSASGAIIFADTGVDSTSCLVACLDFGTTKSSSNTDFRIKWNAEQGIFYESFI